MILLWSGSEVLITFTPPLNSLVHTLLLTYLSLMLRTVHFFLLHVTAPTMKPISFKVPMPQRAVYWETRIKRRRSQFRIKYCEEFSQSFNVKQIKCIEAKLAKPTQHIEALETKTKSCDSIFKGVHKQHKLVLKSTKGGGKKRKPQKVKWKKEKADNGTCVGNALRNDLPNRLVYPPNLAVPEECN